MLFFYFVPDITRDVLRDGAMREFFKSFYGHSLYAFDFLDTYFLSWRV
jgi:hypothetical protein